MASRRRDGLVFWLSVAYLALFPFLAAFLIALHRGGLD